MAPEPELTRGTIETLFVDIDDFVNNLTNLAAPGVNARFDVKDVSGNFKMQDIAITVNPTYPMRAQCLINTTLGGNWASGRYELVIRYADNPDAPILGGLWFKVNP